MLLLLLLLLPQRRRSRQVGGEWVRRMRQLGLGVGVGSIVTTGVESACWESQQGDSSLGSTYYIAEQTEHRKGEVASKRSSVWEKEAFQRAHSVSHNSAYAAGFMKPSSSLALAIDIFTNQPAPSASSLISPGLSSNSCGRRTERER
jgi:hypothetical protein